MKEIERGEKRFLVRPSIRTLTDLTLPNWSPPPFLCLPFFFLSFFFFYFLLSFIIILGVGPISRVRVGYSAQAVASLQGVAGP